MALWKITLPDTGWTDLVMEMTEAEVKALIKRIEALDKKYAEVLAPSCMTVTPITPNPEARAIIDDYITETIRDGDAELAYYKRTK